MGGVSETLLSPRIALEGIRWAVGTAGSAPPWHGGGRRFESGTVHITYSNTALVAQ